MDDARPDLGNAGTAEERRSGVGGSDAAAAIGISPWKTPYDLWEEKVGLAPALGEETEPMLWGKLLEDIIRQEYARRTGMLVTYRKELIRHPARPWQFVHLDGEVGNTGEAILEVKTARDARGWGEPDTDAIPLHYLAQVHHSLCVTAAQVCDVAVLIGGSDFRLYRVERDIQVEQLLIDAETEFWESVTKGEPPPPTTLQDAVKRWGHIQTGGFVVAGETEEQAVAILRRGKQLQKELDEAEEHAKLVITEALRERGSNLVAASGELLATWKLDNGRKAYSVEAKPPSRRLLIKDEV